MNSIFQHINGMPFDVSQRIITTVSTHVADPETVKNAHIINELICNILIDEGYFVNKQTGEITVYQELRTAFGDDPIGSLRQFRGSKYV